MYNIHMSNIDFDKIQHLLNEASKVKKKYKRTKNASTVNQFIAQKGIQSGNKKVPCYRIYYEYMVKFKKNYPDIKLKKPAFFREFAKQFPAYRTRTRGFMLNDALTTDHNTMLQAKTFDVQYKTEARRKGNEKKESKTDELLKP